jgi:hypothetical protein
MKLFIDRRLRGWLWGCALSLLLWAIIAGLIALLLGCAGGHPVAIQEPIVVTLEKVTVIFVPDSSYFPEGFQDAKNAGTANTKNVIYVLGRTWGQGGVEPNYAILGHEIAHLLHWRDGRFADPDEGAGWNQQTRR